MLTDEIDQRLQLHCLACRRRLASAVRANRFTETGEATVSVAISNLSGDLRDFQQNRESVSLTCGCSTRSIYYLI